MLPIEKHARVFGWPREKLKADLKRRYEKGASIRQLAKLTGRSYGFVHRILTESGVTFRGRGNRASGAGTKSPANTR